MTLNERTEAKLIDHKNVSVALKHVAVANALSPEWSARLKVFRAVFPWINCAIKQIAGLQAETPIGAEGTEADNLAFLAADTEYMKGTRSENQKIVELHQRQNQEWEKLTGVQPLGIDRDWNVAGLKAGLSLAEINAMPLHELAERIIQWALSLKRDDLMQNPADSGQQNGQSKKIVPDNPDVAKLANKIRRERDTVPYKIDIALDFTNGDEERANNLLRQIRRYPHLLD